MNDAPWIEWLQGGELPTQDFFIGAAEYTDGRTIEYALFGDYVREHDDKQLLEDWNDFVNDDMAECTCRHLRVAVLHFHNAKNGKRGSVFQYGHPEEDCPWQSGARP